MIWSMSCASLLDVLLVPLVLEVLESLPVVELDVELVVDDVDWS